MERYSATCEDQSSKLLIGNFVKSAVAAAILFTGHEIGRLAAFENLEGAFHDFLGAVLAVDLDHGGIVTFMFPDEIHQAVDWQSLHFDLDELKSPNGSGHVCFEIGPGDVEVYKIVLAIF